ncbi:MAG: FemAB-related protein (PEP-CTERM system-associated), partial [Bacteroidia bacterium]
MTLTVRTLDRADIERWDAYVNATDAATFFHRAGWMLVLERAFGHRAHFLYAEDNGIIVAILPLAEVKSLLFGYSLSSLPFCVYGGIVADTEEAAELLRAEACSLAENLQVDALELRNKHSSKSGWPAKELYFTFKKTIDPDDDVNLKAIPNRQRAMIRKGIKEGLASEWDDGTQRIYAVYSESVRNLGTPVFA